MAKSTKAKSIVVVERERERESHTLSNKLNIQLINENAKKQGEKDKTNSKKEFEDSS